MKSKVRAWDYVEIGFVTKTKNKNYWNQYLTWGIWSVLTQIFEKFLVIFLQKICEIEFDKEIYEIICLWSKQHFVQDFPLYLGFYSSLRINSKEMTTFWKSRLIQPKLTKISKNFKYPRWYFLVNMQFIWHFCDLFSNTTNLAISLLFITQRAVKAQIIVKISWNFFYLLQKQIGVITNQILQVRYWFQ